MELFWFLPTHGDGRYLGSTVGARATTWPYLQQIAQAVDHLGFRGVLLPTGRACEDAWVVASALLPLTSQLRFLVALRPGLVAPTLAARMASTFDRLSGGRLLLNIVTGGDPVELAGDGVHLSHDARYELADEFLTIWRALASGAVADVQGAYLDVRGGSLALPMAQRPYPPIYLGGSSAAAHAVAAQHADVYLSWGEPPAAVAAKIADVRGRAAALGRTVRVGLRLHVIVRETDAEAWRDAERLISRLTPPRSRRRRPRWPALTPRASAGCVACIAVTARAWRSAPTYGPASA